MKIVLNSKEVKAVKGLFANAKVSSDELNRAIGAGSTSSQSLEEFLSTCKFANVNIGMGGFVINIDPDFTVDFCEIYADVIGTVSHSLIAMIRTFTILDQKINARIDKWISNEPKINLKKTTGMQRPIDKMASRVIFAKIPLE